MSKLAKIMTHFFIKKNVIEESEKETYYYCYEMLLSTIFNCLVLLSMMFISRLYIETGCFSLAFLMLRRYAGGHHANSHIGCLSFLIISYVVMWVLLKFLNINVLQILTMIFIIFSIIGVFIFAPLDNKNNPLQNIPRLKIISKIIIIALGILSVIFIQIEVIAVYGFVISYACLLVGLSLLIGKIKLNQSAKSC